MKTLLILLLVLPSTVFADMRVSRQISTGNLIEMQSHATAGTLIKNAVASGYIESDIEEVMMPMEAFKLAMKRQAWGSDLSVAQTRRIKEIRIEARKLLSDNTDWYVVRKFENNTAIPAPVTTYRSAIRQVVADAIIAINAMSTIDAVRDYKPVFPDAPGE